MMVRMCHVAVASVLVLFATVGDALSAPAHVSGPSPANGATAVATASTVLSWIAPDATGYDIAFGPVSPPPLVAHQPGTQFNPGALAPSTTYFWQVTARGPGGPSTGPIWSFTTAGSTGTSTSLRRLKLLTWNIQHGLDARGAEAVDEQVALMVDSNADVIGLQEVSIEAGKDLSTLYKRKLEAATGDTWSGVWAPAPRAPIYTPEGNLILTRLPIVSSATTAWDTIPQWPDVIGAKRAAAHDAG